MIRNKLQRFSALFAAMCMLCTCVPVQGNVNFHSFSAALHVAGEDTSISCKMNDKGVATFTGTGVLQANDVGSIEDATSIVIGEGITGIGESCFHGIHFSNLQSLKLPDSLEFISKNAFNNCFGLTDLVIPGNTLLLENQSFDYCPDLTGITILNPNCMIETIFPGTYKTASEVNFRNPYDGSDFRICGYTGSTAQKYAQDHFCIFTDLDTGTVTSYRPEIITPATESNGWKFDRDTGLLEIYRNCSSPEWKAWEPDIKKVVLTSNVIEIPDMAFFGCNNLVEIEIPYGVQTIGQDAFHSCSVTTLKFPSTVSSIGKNSFDNANSLVYVKFLNPYCEIDPEQGSVRCRYVYGYDGSTAEEFAQKWKCKFISLGAIPPDWDEPYRNMESDEIPPLEDIPKETTVPQITTIPKVTTTTVTTPTTSKPKPTITTTTTTTPPSTTVPSKPIIKFEWGKDNWNFNNDDAGFGDFNEKYHPFYVTETVKSQMLRDFGLDYKDTEEIRKVQAHSANSAESVPNKRAWPGSCFGITVSQILAKQGGLDLTKYGGKAIVNQNSNTEEMISVINMLQLMQSNSAMLQAIRQNAIMDSSGVYTQENYLKALISAVKNEPYPVNLAFSIFYRTKQTEDWKKTCHSVIAYGIEDCEYYSEITRKNYSKRILIADPNHLSQNQVYDKSCLYYDPDDYSWIVPNWCRETNEEVYRCYISPNDEKGEIVSIMRYTDSGAQLDVVKNEQPPHYMAGLEVKTSGNAEPVAAMIENKKEDKTQYSNTAGNGTNVAKYFLSDAAESSDSMSSYFAFWNPVAAYELTYQKLSAFELKMDYEDVLYFADAQNVSHVLFKPSGEIDLEGSNSSYDLTMVTNRDICVTDWYSVKVSGKKADSITYYKDADGYILESDNLKNVTVTAKNDKVEVSTAFSAPGKAVLIYEIDEKTIGIKADTDGDGVFETPIKTESVADQAVMPGDLDASGNVDILDVIRFNKFLLGSAKLSDDQFKAADVDQNGIVDSADSLQVLKYVVELITEFRKAAA